MVAPFLFPYKMKILLDRNVSQLLKKVAGLQGIEEGTLANYLLDQELAKFEDYGDIVIRNLKGLISLYSDSVTDITKK